MEEEEDESFDLRHSWRTFTVPAVSTSVKTGPHVGINSNSNYKSGMYTLLRPYRVIGTNSDEQSLFFLSLISPNLELLSATAHLFIQLNAQFRQCVVENEEKLTELRRCQEQQLTNLLEAANGGVKDIVVGSDITQRIVLKHQRELDELQRQIYESETLLEMDLRQSLLAFLKTSAPAAMALFAKGGGKGSLHKGIAKPQRITNISHFVSERVPVRTVELPNLLQREMNTFRPKDMSLRPIAVDISPESSLQTCINSLYEVDQGTEEIATVVEEHLLRLSHKINSVLLLIGSQAEAESILSVPSAELLLQPQQKEEQQGDALPKAGEKLQFVSLKYHSCLKVMLTTRFWGANIIFLWTPSKKEDDGSNKIPSVVEDALNLACAWNADMFSVAILKSSISSLRNSQHGFLEQAQDLSVEVLLQLQRGIARLAYEGTATTVLSSSWNISEESNNQQEKQWQEQQRWDDGYAVTSPACAGSTQTTFNTPVAIRVFIPANVLSPEKHPSPSSRESTVVSSVTGATNTTVAAGAAGGEETMRKNERNLHRSESSTIMQENESFSSNIMETRDSGSRLRHAMTFKKLLLYTFGDSVVVH
ncbi:uncharacterized protein TM35_000014960 [Trypanosoma theileri]|uniref:Uncharacterized protein n=1 Tax=Trypanosoma theileri TaxID=67003 RepID=A0A1X0PAK4_9TRYP|nr:uncharacterized protein TM35_000014960 [Trypanosoma theileri]ORC93619.1 hypothetical protein TM35_000014960 [Trypanosoma theileri]